MWPWVSQICSTATSACLIAARMSGTSPPGSITTAFLVASHHNSVQFCWNGVTGMIAAPALALVSVWSVIGMTRFVIAGPDPAIHHVRKALLKRMDTRVKPAYDELAGTRREPIRKFCVGVRAAMGWCPQ